MPRRVLHLETDFTSKPPEPFQRKRGGSYYIRQYIAGRDCWRSLHTTHLPTARHLALEIWRARQSGAIKEIVPKRPKSADMIWLSFTGTDKYAVLAQSTKASKLRNWLAFAKWCDAHRINAPEKIGADMARQYLESRDVKNKTWNNLIDDLGTVFAAIDAENPFAGVKRKSIRVNGDKGSERFRAFSNEEVKRIVQEIEQSKMAHGNEWIEAVRIALCTGLRYIDIAFLRWDSLKTDIRGEYLEVVPAKTKGRNGGKAVYIRCSKPLSALFARIRQSNKSEYVLPGLAGSYQRGDKVISTMPFSQLLKRIGIDGSFHCFRVTVATRAAMEGVDLKEMGGVLGHESVGQTEAYNRAAIDIDLSFLVPSYIM